MVDSKLKMSLVTIHIIYGRHAMSGTFNENANWNSEVQRGTNATHKPIHQLQFYLPPSQNFHTLKLSSQN